MSETGTPGFHYGRAIKRWWGLIVVTTFLGLIAGFASAKSPAKASATTTKAASSPAASSYSATSILLPEAANGSITSADPSGLSLSAMAFFVTNGDVPRNVATALHYQGDPETLASQVSATVNSAIGVLEISTTQPTAARAVQLVTAFDDQLIAYLNGVTATNVARQKQADQAELAALQTQLASLESQSSTAANKAAIAAVTSEYTSTYTSYEQLQAAPTHTGLTVVQPPVATPGGLPVDLAGAAASGSSASGAATSSSATSSGSSLTSKIPQGKVTRAILGGFVGFLIGLALALIADRLDRRLYDRADIEEAFGAPVVVEIDNPGLEPVVATSPLSSAAERYRTLQAAILSLDSGATKRMVVLTSLKASVPASVVAANLALAFADTGEAVATVGASGERRLWELPGENPGAARRAPGTRSGPVLQRLGGPGVDAYVKVLPEWSDVSSAGSAQAGGLVDEARSYADVVIVDAGAALRAHHAALLAPSADAVLVVAVAGFDTADQARWAMSLLERCDAPVAGVVVIRPGFAERRRLRRQARATSPRHMRGGLGPTAARTARGDRKFARTAHLASPGKQGDDSPTLGDTPPNAFRDVDASDYEVFDAPAPSDSAASQVDGASPDDVASPEGSTSKSTVSEGTSSKSPRRSGTSNSKVQAPANPAVADG